MFALNAATAPSVAVPAFSLAAAYFQARCAPLKALENAPEAWLTAFARVLVEAIATVLILQVTLDGPGLLPRTF